MLSEGRHQGVPSGITARRGLDGQEVGPVSLAWPNFRRSFLMAELLKEFQNQPPTVLMVLRGRQVRCQVAHGHRLIRGDTHGFSI